MAASDRCSSENELTMFQTGFSSRNVYHWNAMMSPTDARPDDIQVAAVPDDHDVDRAEQQAPRRPDDHLATLREQLLAQHGVAPVHVLDQLAHLAAERAHDADAGERLADAAVDLLGVLAQRSIDRPDAARRREADEHDARNDRERRQREPPVQRHQHDDRDDQPDDRDRRRHDRHLQQSRRRIHVARDARQDAAGLHVPELRQRQMQQALEQRTPQRQHHARVQEPLPVVLQHVRRAA